MKFQSLYKISHCLAMGLLTTIAVFSVLLLSSCEKYLDAKSDSKEQIPATLKDCQLLMNHNSLYTNFPIDGEGSTDDLIIPDNNFGALAPDYKEVYQWLPNAQHFNYANSQSWSRPYNSILYVNLVLDTYGKLSTADQNSTAGKNVRGQALFYRSFYFHELAQLYTKPYDPATAATDPGIPLRLTADITEKLTRGTVQQTYDQIINDLTTAVDLLPEFSDRPSLPIKAAGYAALARAYLTKGDYANALLNATRSLALKNQLVDYNTLNLNNYYPFTPFPDSNKEVLFHGHNLGALISSSYVNPQLYALYDSNDLRKSLFFLPGSNGLIRFIGSYTGTYTNFTGLAVDEMYLVKAECEARTGKVTEALNTLNTLLVTRHKTGSFVAVTAVSADEALSEILLERRKELVYRGTRWADLRRLNKDPRFAVTQTRTIKGTVYTLPPNDLRYTLLIPADNIQYGGYEQNPR